MWGVDSQRKMARLFSTPQSLTSALKQQEGYLLVQMGFNLMAEKKEKWAFTAGLSQHPCGLGSPHPIRERPACRICF